ncbi:helix-turn-helix domain-containing protein [Rhodobacter capsulatus]|uniref:helix-turn-helix domain-containing protein n=1 Tax=Rhodobacter capsulatus TaxID=1061 RepID=UPI00402556FC
MAKVVHLNGQRPGGWAKGRWDWMRQVRRCADLSPMARLVAQSLAQGFSNAETGECRPGAQALAEDCATSVKTIERVLRELELAGWVERLGGNAPGIRAAIRFRFPNEPENPRRFAGSEHPSDLRVTPLSSEFPPRPPYKDQPNMNQKDGRHPVAQIRGLPMPKISTVLVPFGSEQEAEWNAWLQARGFARLGVIGHAMPGGWLMPLVRAPINSNIVVTHASAS